jgi:hypothetical protein
MPILSSVDVPVVAIMLHGHSPLVSTKTMPRFFPVQQATLLRRASKTLENVEPAFRYSLCVPSEQQAVGAGARPLALPISYRLYPSVTYRIGHSVTFPLCRRVICHMPRPACQVASVPTAQLRDGG